MIAVVTGGEAPEHVRFALAAQAELGERVVGWWMTPPSRDADASTSTSTSTGTSTGTSTSTSTGTSTSTSTSTEPESGGARRASPVERLQAAWRVGGLRGVVERLPRAGREVVRKVEGELGARARKQRLADARARLFFAEIQALTPKAEFPRPIVGEPPDDALVVIALDATPAVPGARVLTSAPAANVLTALYHRRLDWLVADVRDAGRVVREGWPVLAANDSPEVCSLRAAALAGELLIEAAREALVRHAVSDRLLGTRPHTLYEPPPDAAARVERDFNDGWLAAELSRARHY